MLVRCCLLLLLVSSLVGCTSYSSKSANWPENIPPREYFVEVYMADEKNRQEQSLDNYLMWVVRFYQGWKIYPRGWLRMTNELLETVDDPQLVEQISIRMADLGQTICGEWAKKSDERRIYTSHVAAWGNALLEAMARGEELQLISSIQRDVDSLLARELDASVVTLERYYARDNNDPFALW
jgi:hypothetical protein